MKKDKLFTLLIFVLAITSSCFKEEEIINLPPTEGNLEIGIAELTETYKYQVYYDLSTNTAIRTNFVTDWDLGFSCSDTEWNIIINNSKVMFAGNSENTNFEEVVSSSGVEMKFDSSDGNTEKGIAISDWYDTNNQIIEPTGYTYIIDRGVDENNLPIGFKKVVFDIGEKNEYIIKCADLNGENKCTFTVEKDDTKNFICLSLDKGIVDIEPPKTDWTLLFSSYQTYLYTSNTDSIPYLVRGVQLNPNNTVAFIDTIRSFDTIYIQDTISYNFSTKKDYIGHNWKYYDFDNGTYSVVEDLNYIIRDNNQFYYKLNFISYYNSENQKGYPTFRFKRL